MVAELTTAYNVRKMVPFIREDGNSQKNTHRTHRQEEEKNERKHHTLNITGC